VQQVEDSTPTNEMTWSSDGQFILIGTSKGLWEYSVSDPGVSRLKTNCVEAAFNPAISDDMSAVAYSTGQQFVVYSTQSNELALQATSPRQQIRQLALSQDGGLLAVSSADRDETGWLSHPLIQIWDTHRNQVISEYVPNFNIVNAIEFDPMTDSLWLSGIQGGTDGPLTQVQLVESGTAELIMTLPQQVADYAISDMTDAVVAYASVHVEFGYPITFREPVQYYFMLWDMKSPDAPIVIPHPSSVAILSTASNGLRVASVTTEGMIQVWNASGPLMSFGPEIASSIALRPTGDILAVGRNTNGMPIVDLWDVTSGTQMASLDTSDWLSQCEGT
jgi:WD40 repeat protein